MKPYQLKSIAHMHEKSARAIELAKNGKLESARRLIDEIRFLRAVFTTKLELEKDREPQLLELEKSSKELAPQVTSLNDNLEVIFNWINTTRKEFSFEELINSPAGVNVYLDSQIPAVWNWLEDIIIIPEDIGGHFTNALAARGQKKIIVLNSGQSLEGFRYIDSVDSAASELADWMDDPVGRQIFIPTSPNSDRDEILLKELREIFQGFITRHNTKRKFSRRWALQQIANLTKVVSNQNIRDLAPLFEGKNCIVVSPGPSLKKNVALLKNQDFAQQQIIIAAAQACPALLEAKITPDFVMVIDPQDLSVTLAGTDCSKIYGLIVGDTCHPAFYQLPFQNIFTYFAGEPAFNVAKIVAADPFPMFGGSVTVAAVYLAVILGIKEVSLIGSDLSFEKEMYYTGSKEPVLAKRDQKKVEIDSQIRIPGYYGGEVKTLANYLMFKRELEELAGVWGEAITLNNCTEGGAYIEGFNHIPLHEITSNKVGEEKNLYVSRNSEKEVKVRLKVLLKTLNEERANLNKAKTLAVECIRLAERVKNPEDKKLAPLNKKEKKLSLLISNSESLDTFCDTEIAAIHRKIARINSFDANIALSKSMYFLISEAIETLRTAISEQITSIQAPNSG